MKNNRLPLYVVFVLIAAAIVYRITNPPAPAMPGPLGKMPAWKSTVALGKMISQAVNPSGTRWAGVWVEPDNTSGARSAVWIIDFNRFTAQSCLVPKDVEPQSLTWANDDTIRLICTSASGKGKGPGVVSIDAASARVKSRTYFAPEVARIVYWPVGSDVFIGELAGRKGKVTLAAFSGRDDKASIIGRPIDFDMPRDGEFYHQAGIASDGRSFVFSVTDPAANDGRSYYLADTGAGTAKKMFDLADAPGLIEGIWPSAAGVLMACKIDGKLADVLYEPSTGKLVIHKGGVPELARWPGAPRSIGYTSIDGGFSFDLATGKNKTLFRLKKAGSYAEQQLRDAISMCRLYRITSGNLITVSESSGAVDIRELKPDGSLYRNVLPRQ